MDKIQVLIEKYGLSESVAYYIEREIEKYLLYSKPISKHKTTKQDAIDEIIQSEPTYTITEIPSPTTKERPKYDADGKPYKSHVHVVGNPKVIEIVSNIQQVKFILKKETVTIDDPSIIEKLRQCLIDTTGSERAANRPKSPQKAILKPLVVELMKYKQGSKYAKYKFSENVLSEYIQITSDTVKNLFK